MTRCMYVHDRELNEDRPPNDSTKSLEHIVPWALGGSSGLRPEAGRIRTVSISVQEDPRIVGEQIGLFFVGPRCRPIRFSSEVGTQ